MSKDDMTPVIPTEATEAAETENTQPDELALLKERARQMGIPIGGNIGIDTLRARINAQLNGTSEEAELEAVKATETAEATPAAASEASTKEATKEASDEPAKPRVRGTGRPVRGKPTNMVDMERRERLHREKNRLVRCRIYNLNPAKRDLEGELITVNNKYLGSVTKMIPFGEKTENGYHLPYWIYKALTRRKFQQVSTTKVDGQMKISRRLVPEYNIEILPDLTEAELRDLAVKQAAAAQFESTSF